MSLSDQLAGYLTVQLGAPVEVTDLHRISVGHSRAMYALVTTAGRFVVRAEQGGVFGSSGTAEYRIMEALGRAGAPVARVRWLEPTGNVIGQPFFVMDHVESTPVDDERAMDDDTARRFVAAIDALHRLAPNVLAGVVPEPDDHDPRAATRAQIERWAGIYRAASPDPIPLLEEAIGWLNAQAPPCRRLSVVHGDAGPGNVLVRDGVVAAITDFEFAHLGDPMEDWSFCSAMRGSRTMEREAWYTIFREVAGVAASPEVWAYWEAFNLFKGACANVTCLDLYRRQVNPAPNMAIIGTALHHSFLRRLVELTARRNDHLTK